MIAVYVPGLMSMALFYAMIFLVGAYAFRQTRGAEDASGLLLAGRRLPLLVGVFTMTATWVGGGYINATAEAVYDPQRGLLWCQAPWCYALSLILGGLLFARPMRRAGFTTMLDPFDRRYGKRVAAVLFVPAVLGEVFWSAAILAALGMTFAAILGLDVPTSIWISAAVAISYTVLGGLWSVAWTDVLQLLCIVGGLMLAIPFAAAHTGGLSTTVAEYLQEMPQHSLVTGWQWFSWGDIALMLVLGGIPWQVYFQRVLACPDERSAVRLSLYAGIGCALMAIPAVLIGAIGARADWSALGLPPPENPSMVLPHVVLYLTTPMVATVALGAVSAAVMSSVDSSILSASSMFAWNIYRPLVRTQAGAREIQCVTRLTVLLVGLCATTLALQVQSVYVLWALCADLVYVVLFPQLVVALFARRASARAALLGVAAGTLLRWAGGEPSLNWSPWIPLPCQGHFPVRTFAMLANLLVTAVLTARWGQPMPVERNFEDFAQKGMPQ